MPRAKSQAKAKSQARAKSQAKAKLPAKAKSQARIFNRKVVDASIATFCVILVGSPLLFTSNGFYPDFTNALWMASVQQHMIAAHLHPTLFLNTRQQGIFQPQFAFYGGTLFAVTGAIAVVLGGSTVLAFDLVTMAGMAAAYGGLFWIARQLGVRNWLAHAPAVVFLTSAYYVTDLYGRGAWAEFMAVSAFVLVLAASLRLLRGPLRAGPACSLVGASIIFTGSHNITLLLGVTTVVGALVLYWLLSRWLPAGGSRQLPRRRAAIVAGLIVLSGCVNAWFLLPDVVYAHQTLVSGTEIPWSSTRFFNSFGVIFDPLRTVPRQSEAPGLFVQIPVLALIWALLALPLVWRQRRLRAGAATALLVLFGLLLVIMSPTAYAALPSLIRQIQFPYRFQTYVTLSCAALVLLGVIMLTRRAGAGRATQVDRRLSVGLGLVLTFGVGVCIWQLWVPETRYDGGYYDSYVNRADALHSPPTEYPRSWYAPNGYGDSSLPVVAATVGGSFDPAQVHDEKLVEQVSLPSTPFTTNIAGGPNLVQVGDGLRVVGRTSQGYLVLQRTGGGKRDQSVEVKTRLSPPVSLGRIVSALASIALLGLGLIAATRAGWRRVQAVRRPVRAQEPAA